MDRTITISMNCSGTIINTDVSPWKGAVIDISSVASAAVIPLRVQLFICSKLCITVFEHGFRVSPFVQLNAIKTESNTLPLLLVVNAPLVPAPFV